MTKNEGVSTPEIVHVTPTSPLLREWHSVMRTAYTDGHEAIWWESLAHLRHLVTHPHSRSTRCMFAAIQDGHCVGALELIIAICGCPFVYDRAGGGLRHRRATAGIHPDR